MTCTASWRGSCGHVEAAVDVIFPLLVIPQEKAVSEFDLCLDVNNTTGIQKNAKHHLVGGFRHVKKCLFEWDDVPFLLFFWLKTTNPIVENMFCSTKLVLKTSCHLAHGQRLSVHCRNKWFDGGDWLHGYHLIHLEYLSKGWIWLDNEKPPQSMKEATKEILQNGSENGSFPQSGIFRSVLLVVFFKSDMTEIPVAQMDWTCGDVASSLMDSAVQPPCVGNVCAMEKLGKSESVEKWTKRMAFGCSETQHLWGLHMWNMNNPTRFESLRSWKSCNGSAVDFCRSFEVSTS